MSTNGHTDGEFKYLGKGRRIIDGFEKVAGYARYAADVKLHNMAYARVILSPYAHATINEIDTSAALEIEGVVAVLTAQDLVTKDRTITSRNSALLAKEKVLWVGQPVAVVVAENDMIAADAADMVFIDYDPLPAVISLEEAIKPDAPLVWPNGLPQEGEDMSSLHAQVEGGDAETEEPANKPNNTFTENHFERGDIAAGFAEADVIVERTYKTSVVHQGYLEPHAVVADPHPMGRGVTVYTSTQGQYGVRNEVAKLLNLPLHEVTVEPQVVGGGFGAKYGIYDPLTAAVALAVERPVRIFLSRSEDFLSTTPAPQIFIDLKTGAKKDGTVTTLEARVITDNGIFSFNHGGIVSVLLGGYYKFQNLKIDAYEVNTHKAQVGAYRAPGAPQATFAIESHMDDMAAQLGLDPMEFRLQNAVEEGDLMGVGAPWPGTLGLKQCLEVIRDHPIWKDRKPGEGVGIASGGWPTAVGRAEAICRVDTDGRVRINTGIVDISGTRSAMVLVAAETLGVDPDDIIFVQDNTNGAFGPGSGGSQVTYTVSGAVQGAAEDARNQLVAIAADEFEAADVDIEIVAGQAQVRGVPDKKIGIGQLVEIARNKRGGPGPIVGEGKSAPPENGPAFAAHAIKIKIDEQSGQIVPVQYLTVQDVGFAMNPTVLEGQLQGGAIQGLGMALQEKMVYSEDGQLLTASFLDYSLPRIDDVPEVEVVLVENPSPFGPFGARGVAESPLTPGPAAVANAIKDLVGVRVTELPIQAEPLWNAMQAK